MFTGLVEELGTVTAVEERGDAMRVHVAAGTVLEDLRPGDSVAVDGCCLTVSALDADGFGADVMPETLRVTTAGSWAPGARVNLERAVRADARLGGHLVQGHVDAIGVVVSRAPGDHWDLVEVSLPARLGRYLVAKGSVTVDGVSLTVVAAGDDRFTVGLIPETLSRTTLGLRRPGDPVNLEVDVLAKYVERLLAARGAPEAPDHPPPASRRDDPPVRETP